MPSCKFNLLYHTFAEKKSNYVCYSINMKKQQTLANLLSSLGEKIRTSGLLNPIGRDCVPPGAKHATSTILQAISP